MISRRKLLTGAAAVAAAASLPSPAKALTGCIPGAIRFDSWYTTGDIVSDGAQNFLSPQAYQYRAPWFCQAKNVSQLTCTGSQALMDIEIQCAANANLKFWAFDYAAPGNPLNIAWGFYQTSSFRALMNFCWITNLSSMGSTGNFTTQVNGFAANYQLGSYQTVLSGRPLHFILWSTAIFAQNWSSNYTNVAAMITALRAAAATAGVGNPFIVVLSNPFTNTPATIASAIGADATSFYNTSNVGTYSALVNRCESEWTSQAAFASGASLGFVPTAVTGWDIRDIIQSPAVWYPEPYTYQAAPSPLVGMLGYAQPGTISQVATHVGDCVTFTKANAAVCASTAMLICAWDECAEEGGATTGGGLIPTIGDPVQGGNTTNMLTALATVLA